ncbi:MAG: serine hydrolase domain-containing protein [Pseudomonadota bacterium]|jgi:CubicO group peptidase (beta-lactamase class C family)|uniref:serine hydrolase domain-containing protein n=1 Tax=Silanimonas sp. TaxID=1929290 RepID=UPI0022C34E48|nr:serine hydrolase domain-containing protein [Silanimonas sp.]MCZ8115494.1 serine hydrolase [Silanimonas sp.]
MFGRLVIAVCASLATSTLAVAEPGDIAGLPKQEISRYADDFMAEELGSSGSPGALVVLVDRSGNRWLRGYGFADSARKRRMDPERDYFRIASQTKVLTAIAVLRQVEKGRLLLDDDVEKHLGGLRLKPHAVEPVTIRHLLQHVSGVSSIAMAGSAVRWTDPVPRLATTLAEDTPRRLRRPGVTIAYTNGAYTLLGRVLETVTGLDYHAAMEAEVFGPLGLAGASTNARTIPHDQLVEGVLLGETARLFSPAGTNTPPSGDAVMTAMQMSRFLEMMLNQGQLGDRQVLSPGMFQRMVHDCFYSSPHHDGLCLGPKRDRYGSLSFLMHGGDYISQKSGWWVIPDKGIALWIGVNSNDGLDDLFFARFVRRFFPAEANVTPPRLAGPPGPTASAWVGTYRPNSSVMGGGGRFFDILPPAKDVTVRALAGDRLAIDDLPYERVGPSLFRREPGASPENDLLDSESMKLVRFLTGPDGDTQMQRADRSATRIAWWQNATINLAFARVAGPALALLGFLALSRALLKRRIASALAGGACLVTAMSVAAFLRLPAYGVDILFGVPASVRAAEAGFWLAGTLALAAAAVSIPKCSRAPDVPLVICAVAALLTVGWAAYWDMI